MSIRQEPSTRKKPGTSGATEKPVLPVPSQYVEYGNYLEDRTSHIHAGEDFSCPTGTVLTACEDGEITVGSDPTGYGDYINLAVGRYWLRYAHVSSIDARGNVRKGDPIGLSGGAPGAPGAGSSQGEHLHFEVRTDGPDGFGSEGTIAPEDYLTGAVDPGGGTQGDPSTVSGGGFGEEDVFAVARAAAFSTQLEIPGLSETFSNLFGGDKSIYNDQPLLPFIQQLCEASFRHFQSLPNGAFFAFFPDYFGSYGHRKPYWQIDDIEIIDGGIELTDETLATHVFVAGDINANGSVDFQEMVRSKGVITIFDAFNSDKAINKESGKDAPKQAQLDPFVKLQGRVEAMEFLKRYGVRPHIEQPTFIRNPYFEVFYAYMMFQLMWSKQFLTTFTFTFMPELYPGGIVAFEQHGFQCYIESVTHSFDYEGGFTTQANLMAPAALGEDKGYSQGMIRSIPTDDSGTPQFGPNK